MSSPKTSVPPLTTDAAANASNGDAVKVEASAGGGCAAVTRGGSTAPLSQQHDAVQPHRETSTKKLGGCINADGSFIVDGDGSGASWEKENTTTAAEIIGSYDTLGGYYYPVPDRLARLGLVMSRVEDPFFCEGQVNLYGKKLKLQLLPKASSVSEGASKTAVQELELPSPFFAKFSEEQKKKNVGDIFKILKDAPLRPEFSKILENFFEASPFGHGGQTVLDESVRKAMQVKADRIVSTGVDLEETGILESIRLGLAPTATRIHASLDKLNLYTRDGHFKSHRDTPRDELAFGTLVVALPSTFHGGDLVVRHRGVNRICKWSEALTVTYSRSSEIAELIKKYTESPTGPLQWCAFYGHCDHEIKPVEEGHRLTLTYILRYDPADEGIAQHMADGLGASPKKSVNAGLNLGSQGSDEDGHEEEEEEDDDTDTEPVILSTLTYAKLKDRCRAQGLELTGSKVELVARLLEKQEGGVEKRGGGEDLPDLRAVPPAWVAELNAEVGNVLQEARDAGADDDLMQEIKDEVFARLLKEQGEGRGLPDVGVYPPAFAAELGTGVLRELRDAIADDDFMEDGSLVGVPCMHLYEQDADLPPLDESVLNGKFVPWAALDRAAKGPAEGKSAGEDKPPVLRARDLRLKGVDAVVYMCAARLGLQPMVLRIVWDDFNKYSLKKMPSLQTAYNKCFLEVVDGGRVSLVIVPGEAFGRSAKGPCQGGDDYDGRTLKMDKVFWVNPAPFEDEAGTKAPSATLLPSILMNEDGYFGNEASQTTFYAAAAIIFVVPPVESEGRRVLIENAQRGLGTPASTAEGGHDKPPPPIKKAKTGKPPAGETDIEDEQSLSEETEQEAAFFEGLRRGLPPQQEKRAWANYFNFWKRDNPDVSRADAVSFAKDYGVSTTGSTDDILSRIWRSVGRDTDTYIVARGSSDDDSGSEY